MIRYFQMSREIFWNWVSWSSQFYSNQRLNFFKFWIGAGIGIVSVVLGVLRSGLDFQYLEAIQEDRILTTDVREFKADIPEKKNSHCLTTPLLSFSHAALTA
jgi:hypothetical protein